MPSATFDTHAAVKALTKAGLGEREAEAITETVRDARTADLAHLATKADLYKVAFAIVAANVALTVALLKLL